MTVTLKPWMTVLLIATVCVLAGFTAGQVTTANSNGATVSRLPDAYWLKQMERGIDRIEKSSLETCRAVSGRDWYCN